MTGTAHTIELYADRGEIHYRLVCAAPPDAPCRQRPTVERESWSDADPDVTPGHQCWATERVEEVGIDNAVLWGSRDTIIASAPVHISYDDGVVLDPVMTTTDREDQDS